MVIGLFWRCKSGSRKFDAPDGAAWQIYTAVDGEFVGGYENPKAKNQRHYSSFFPIEKSVE